MNLDPINQTNLYGIEDNLMELFNLYDNDKLPNKILLSGEKGIGKSTLAFHLVNYVLSKGENYPYDKSKFKINPENSFFKLTNNKSNPNLFLIDIPYDKKTIDISQIRNLIQNLSKSSFNDKPRFVLIDNVEFLNINSVNALLKILEEPSQKTFFILINNNKKILSTLKSRCLNFKIFLSNQESVSVTDKLLQKNINNYVNKDLLNYYLTPGNTYNLVRFAIHNNYDFTQYNLKNFLKFIIQEQLYKKDIPIKYMINDFFEFYLRKNIFVTTNKIGNYYSYFIKKFSDTKKFNLDEEALFIEFENKLLNE